MAAKRKHDWTEILIAQGIISREQLAEAQQMADESDMKVTDALIRLGYATGEEVMRAMAQQHGLDYVDLSQV
ncbi:MAG: type II/IV secretion system protein, partial [Pirellulales bacterium]|nr:type II/IV secretion system protein [Pirellulales bacterium]